MISNLRKLKVKARVPFSAPLKKIIIQKKLRFLKIVEADIKNTLRAREISYKGEEFKIEL